jgi:predicted GNAT superfamily acetyltransferase
MGAARHEPEVRSFATMAEIAAATALLAEIWGEPGPMSPEMLRALGHAGGYAAGAWVGAELVGVSAGFLGRHDGALLLHSHISGVKPDRQGGSVGFALKQHQRQWAKQQGISTIEWTFDPLARRNAYFNLAKLGAMIVGFEADFYGSMGDAINVGDESDRAIVRWHLGATLWERVDGGDAVILSPDDAGGPVVTPSDAPLLRAWIPEDHMKMREADPALARRWRRALRDTFGVAVQGGYVAFGMTRDGWYTLGRSAP